MSHTERDARRDALFLDIDLRLREIWQEAFEVEEDLWGLESAGEFMRASYGRGYMDALTEPIRAQLFRDHGYKIPRRKAL